MKKQLTIMGLLLGMQAHGQMSEPAIKECLSRKMTNFIISETEKAVTRRSYFPRVMRLFMASPEQLRQMIDQKNHNTVYAENDNSELSYSFEISKSPESNDSQKVTIVTDIYCLRSACTEQLRRAFTRADSKETNASFGTDYEFVDRFTKCQGWELPTYGHFTCTTEVPHYYFKEKVEESFGKKV